MRTTSLLIAGTLSALLTVAAVLSVPTRAASSTDTLSSVKSVSTRFTPSRDGFAFINHPVAEEGVLGTMFSGLCGGMSYAALDYYRVGKRPANAGIDRYLMLRDTQSLLTNARTFVRWTLAPDAPPRAGRFGVSTATRKVEVPELARRLKDGPVAIGLVKARDLAHIGENHQVVAYALERDGSSVRVRVYDPNHVQSDDTFLDLDLSKPSSLIVQQSDGDAVDAWRGLFVEDYAPARPPGS